MITDDSMPHWKLKMVNGISEFVTENKKHIPKVVAQENISEGNLWTGTFTTLTLTPPDSFLIVFSLQVGKHSGLLVNRTNFISS